MAVIKETAPVQLNSLIDPILLRYGFPCFIDKENKSYLAANLSDAENPAILESIRNGLSLLKRYKYIRHFNELAYANGKYREKGGCNTYKDLGRYIMSNPPRKGIFVIHHFKDRLKWEYLQRLRLDADITMDIDTDEVEKIVTAYFLGWKGITSLIGKLKFEFAYAFPNREDLNEETLTDFLYYYAHSFKNGFEILKQVAEEESKNPEATDEGGLKFSKASGDIHLGESFIGNLIPGNRDFKFFEYLYDNKGDYVSHDDLKNYIMGSGRISGTLSAYCSDIKAKMKEEIKCLIQGKKGGYRIP